MEQSKILTKAGLNYSTTTFANVNPRRCLLESRLFLIGQESGRFADSLQTLDGHAHILVIPVHDDLVQVNDLFCNLRNLILEVDAVRNRAISERDRLQQGIDGVYSSSNRVEAY